MNKLLTMSAIGLCTLSFGSYAAQAGGDIKDVELSANVGFVSEYSFRGIQQSNEKPALQGGFDLTHSSGLYAGVWGSNVDFNDDNEATLETDVYAGYSGEVKSITYDLGMIYYAYPGADNNLNYNYMEMSLALGHDFGPFTLTGSLNYSPNNFGDSGDATYVAAAVEVPVSESVKLNAHVGHQTIEDEDNFAGIDDYTDWSAGVGYSHWGMDFGLQYVDTSISHAECSDGCDERVIASVSKTF